MYYVSFPKNIWKKIKEFEFQLLYPKEVQILFLNDIKLIINSNYFFLLDEILIPKFNRKIDFDSPIEVLWQGDDQALFNKYMREC